MSRVLKVQKLGFPWETADPFLFCVHHDDAYPAGNADMGPAASLAGREIGQDFSGKDGWSMYHGEVVPGFPQHPHRGFETVTLARQGYIDHTDSMGASARFGRGDVQWMTAGRGVVHSEMFPLVQPDAPNPVELFQIWLNLARADKMVEPHFTMFWGDDVPVVRAVDAAGGATTITVVAGALDGARPLTPQPHSWAAQPENDVAIWTIAMASGAQWTLPPAQATSNRTLYVFRGDGLRVDDRDVPRGVSVTLQPDSAVTVVNGAAPSQLLLLQGRPIGEPVAQYGPFVMNTRAEIQQAMLDYRRTGFGGWPWPEHAPVHPRDKGRFANHGTGLVETPEGRLGGGLGEAERLGG